MQDLYIYVDKNIASDCLKYGIKLSEQENSVLSLKDSSKRGIRAFLSPKDSPLYKSEDFECIRVLTNGLTAIAALPIVFPKLPIVLPMPDYLPPAIRFPPALPKNPIPAPNAASPNPLIRLDFGVADNLGVLFYPKLYILF